MGGIEGVFRRARTDDVDRLLELMRDYYQEDDYPFDEELSRAAALGLIDHEDRGWLFVIEEEGVVLGYLAVTLGYSLEYLGRDAFVDEVYVRPEARGKGYGTHALELATALCREAGVRALHLEVERKKQSPQRLYRKHGFIDHDRFLMTKRLDEGEA